MLDGNGLIPTRTVRKTCERERKSSETGMCVACGYAHQSTYELHYEEHAHSGSANSLL